MDQPASGRGPLKKNRRQNERQYSKQGCDIAQPERRRTGSVREVVQRALKTLEKDGVIRLERARVIILDPKALERWSDTHVSWPP